MPETLCGFDNIAGGAPARELLVAWGPTLMVDVGFDPNFTSEDVTKKAPTPGIKGIRALVDTGASESCIDNLLAGQLNLPIVDRRAISGVHGSQVVNMYMAQIHVPSLAFTIYGAFAGVDLAAGGQVHSVLIGRTFLQNFTMVYEGLTGTVKLSR
jgi:predicted aspartyl protease